jgi:hypothetical protein
MSMKNSKDTTGNRTRDLPACSAVTQLNTPPRAPRFFGKKKTNCLTHKRIIMKNEKYFVDSKISDQLAAKKTAARR